MRRPAPDAFDLKAYLGQEKTQVNRYLKRCLAENGRGETRLMAAMAHSLNAGGKRLRPILCLATARMLGASAENALPFACALECIHTYSLIHDDLPAMDDDDLRRGQPTCHVAFDEATAILAGDALLTLAFEIMAAPEAAPMVLPDVRLAIIHQMARAAGYLGMVEGQMQDMAAEKDAGVTIDCLQQLHRLKTGALITAAVKTGALVAGADPAKKAALAVYADSIGLAFQVSDDILNVEGDANALGKAVGTDAARGKSTYPALLGLDASKAHARQLIEKALTALECFGGQATALRAIASYILTRTH